MYITWSQLYWLYYIGCGTQTTFKVYETGKFIYSTTSKGLSYLTYFVPSSKEKQTKTDEIDFDEFFEVVDLDAVQLQLK